MLVKERKIITLGAEQEYCSAPNVNLHGLVSSDVEDLEIQLEYYQNMIEFNEILFSSSTSYERIEDNLEKIRKLIEDKAIQIYDYIKNVRGRGVKLYLSSMPFYVREIRALIFNGLHLHINADAINIGAQDLRKLVAYFKKEINNDVRFNFSHHLWGGIANSSYVFKKKIRFSPAVLTSHGTFELRVFTYNDLKEYANKLAYFIHLLTSIKDKNSICKIMDWDWRDIEEFWRMFKDMEIDIGDYSEGHYTYKNEELIIDCSDNFVSYGGSLYAVFRERIQKVKYSFEEEL